MHEIIHVAASAAPAGATPLAPGYYFVLCVARRRCARRQLRHFGPFGTRAEARMVQKSALALGLVPPERRAAPRAAASWCWA